MKILVRMPNWIGDLVMATPVLADLRRQFPEASITAMSLRSLSELIAKDPSIDELFCFTKPVNRFSRREQRRNIIEKIRAGGYDLGILLTNSFSSAWWFWQGKVKRRIGFADHFRKILLTDPVKRIKEQKEHQVITYKRLLEPLGIEISQTEPELFLTAQEMEESKQILDQRGYQKGQILIGINPGAAYGSAKCWPVERFRELALSLISKNRFIVFFGDASTFQLIKEISRGLPEQVINLAGVTGLRELCCLIKDCCVLVTNDSGPMHIGAALKTPLVALFGSTDDELTGPYGQKEAIIHKKPSCSPCFKRTCPIDFRCMREISVEEVRQKVERLLNV